MSDGRVEYDIRANDSHVNKDLDDANRKVEKGASKIGGAAKGIAVAVGKAVATMAAAAAAAAGAFAVKGIGIASDLAEVQNVIDVTFGKSSDIVDDWSKTATGAYGLAELSAKKYTGTMGAMLKSSGVATDKLSEMSTVIAGLAGDFASFYNISSDEAFDKIRSGISGETEPLKQLGINMSVANLEAYALKQGIKETYAEMDQASQVLLRYNYLMSVSADAQGDFARTSGSWANQLRLASLNMDTLSASLGAKLTPALTNVLQTFNQVAQESGGDLDVFLQNFDKVIEAGMKAADEILPIITGIAQQILNGIVKMLPKLLDMGVDIMMNLAQGIIDNMPKLAEALGAIVGKIAAMLPGLLWQVFKSIPIIVTKFIEGLFGLHNPLEDLKDEFDAITKSVDAARDSLKKSNAETEAAARVNSNYANKLSNLIDKENKTAEDKQQILNLVESLNKSMPELNLLYDEQAGKLNMTNGELLNMIENQKELARIEGLRTYLAQVSTGLVEQEQKIKDYVKMAKEAYGIDLTQFKSKDEFINNPETMGYWFVYADYEAMLKEQSGLNSEFNDLNEDLLDKQTTYSKRTGQTMDNTLRDIIQREKDEKETYLKNLQDWNTKVEDAQQKHEDTMGSIYDYGLKKQKITLWQAAKNIAKQVSDMIAYKKNMQTLQGMAESGAISKEVYDQLAGEGTKAAGLIAALTKDPNSKAAQALLGSLQD
ncbi:MAG: hypothetical protein WC374_11390, partial [Phycisphaerae bacterium]